MHWYIDAFKKYAVFSGRSTREAFWMFVLFDIMFTFILSFIDGIASSKTEILSTLYFLFTFIPYIAIWIRRMHDIGRSGWWMLVPIVNFIFLLIESEQGRNKYGPPPRMAR